MHRFASTFRRRALFGAGLGLAATPRARALDYPTRPVRVIVPNPPGGSTDAVGRILVGEFAAHFGQPFVIENRGGAGGNIGTEAMARSAPDGSTLGMLTVTQLITNTYLYRNMPIVPMRDLACISGILETPNVLIVPKEHVPATTLAEFIAWGKAQPDGLSYSSSGVGFTSHMLGELFGQQTGIKVTHVPFRGSADATPSMLRGEVQFTIDNLASWRGQISGGRFRVLASTDRERTSLAPDVPTMTELGLPALTITVWAGMVAPTGTPREIIEALSERMQTLARRPDLQARIAVAGGRLIGTTPEAMRDRAEAERPYWANLVRISGARLD